jgi:hypothetical protein
VDDRSAGDPTLRLRDSEQESQTVIKVGADFYIHASSLTSRRATRALVNGESFAVFEVGGGILQTHNEPPDSFGVVCSAMFKFARAKVCGDGFALFLRGFFRSPLASRGRGRANPNLRVLKPGRAQDCSLSWHDYPNIE